MFDEVTYFRNFRNGLRRHRRLMQEEEEEEIHYVHTASKGL